MFISSNLVAKVEPVERIHKPRNRKKQKCTSWRPCEVCTNIHGCDECPFMSKKYASKEWLV